MCVCAVFEKAAGYIIVLVGFYRYIMCMRGNLCKQFMVMHSS